MPRALEVGTVGRLLAAVAAAVESDRVAAAPVAAAATEPVVAAAVAAAVAPAEFHKR